MWRPATAPRRGVDLGLVTALAVAGFLGLGVVNAGARTADESTVSTAQYLSAPRSAAPLEVSAPS
jgi:hypothetical protein